LVLWTVAAVITLMFPEKTVNSPIRETLGEQH
jgi:hypothetical protein